MTAALLSSLALALTWTPGLSYVLLREERNRAGSRSSRRRLLSNVLAHPSPRSRMGAGQAALDRRNLRHLLVLATWGGYRLLGSDLLPQMDEGGFILDYIMPAGSSLAETNRVLDHVERILHSMPEVEVTSRRTGLQLGHAAVTEANTGDFTVKLKAKRSRSVWEVMSDVRDRIKTTEPELDIELSQVLQDNINDLSNAPEPIQIKLFSNDEHCSQSSGQRLATPSRRFPAWSMSKTA